MYVRPARFGSRYGRSPAFVERNGDRYTGFTSDLWAEVADRLGIQTRFVEVQSVAEQLDAVRDGDADLAATAISITSERVRSLDFSAPLLRRRTADHGPHKPGRLVPTFALGRCSHHRS